MVTLSHHAAKLVGLGHCGNGDKTILICQKFSQEYVIKKSCNFMGGSTS